MTTPTPRERADELMSEWLGSPEGYGGLNDRIEAAIQSAVEAEREACAQEAVVASRHTYPSVIAARIRARKP